MRITDLQRYARIWGLAWLCVGPIVACDEDEPEHNDDVEASGGSSTSAASRTRGSTRSTRAGSSSTSRTSRSETVADCKDSCDEDGDDCKVDCESDDEDCNQDCDDDRYTCRRACEDTQRSDAGSPSDAGASDDEADEDDDERAGSTSDISVSIEFEARVGSAAFGCGKEYDGLGTENTTVTPTDLRLFVQDVKLITSSGKEVPVELDVRKPWQSTDVVLLDFEDGSGECGEGNSQTNTKITGRAPSGTYTGISFSNGVPEALNHEDPTTVDDPIGEFSALSWGWLGGFRFTKVELRQVTDASDFGRAVAHIGSTACSGNPQMGSVKCGKPNRNSVELDDFDAETNVIVLDIAPIFASTDLTQMADCHSTGASCEPMFEAFGVDFATGKALSKQSVFSVE
jgi:uncharacterized repeat protein (TIGR04052 family)